jgi:hypothetical protein
MDRIDHRARENKKDWPAEREIPQTGVDAHHGHAVGQAEAIRAADHHCPSCPVLSFARVYCWRAVYMSCSR